MTLTDQIRRAIETCGLTRYRIAKEIGMSESILSRFMRGAPMKSDNLDRLAKALRLSIRMKGPTKKALSAPKNTDPKKRK